MGRVASRKKLSRRKGDTYRTPKTSKINSEESQHVVPDSSPSADLLHDSEPVFESIEDEQASENKPPNISIDNSKKEVCFESVKIDHVYASPIGSKPKFEGRASVPEPAVLNEELLLEIKHKIELFLPHRWLCLQADNDNVIRVVLISAQNNVSIQRSLEFTHNGDVNFFVHCNPLSIDPYLTGTLPPLPLDGSTVDYFVDRVITIVNNVRKMEICPGYDDEKYQVAWPTCPYGEKDSNPYRECRYSETFRSHACLRLVSNKKWRCSECSKLGKPLKRRTAAAAMETRKANTANKFLTESQMLNKLQEQRQELEKARKRIGRLHSKMEVLIKKEGVKVEQSMSDALSEILNDSKMTPAQSIFMQQQIKASQVEKSSSMRWHPTMLRLALAIHLTSPSAYELLRDTGMVKLPSSRTLFEYSHANRIKEGIDAVVIEKLSARVTKLCEEINPTTKLPEKHKKYHILMADEMYISQNLVFQKFSGKLLGFTSLDDIDSEIRNLEGHLDNPEKELDPVMASKIMVYMVKGVSNGQKEVVATYASANLSATQMYAWTWKVIGALERSGIAVVAFVCDGSSTNRAFIKKHKACDTDQDPNDIVYCTWNKCARGRKLFFISDVPHLLKTIRNCMLNSRWDKLKSRRRMVKNGKRISWDFTI
ncbi:uncharacterized protein LOC127751374 [Frankliniella occidentalis]|uniref:Uncharacterized protein LOC127751374 n=1 Tax=Frankliniella occidentalis TaxID=133901 RepID=A0A9C6XTK5_FRAOC|nr:uncharacterized protein LOC127751374 [Frankliniella occidentalis]